MKGGFNLSRWALEHIPFIRYMVVVLIIGGVIGYAGLGQDEDPPFTFRAMSVSAVWPGATSLQMAEQVTDKLEKKLQETPYIEKIRSYSKPGETVIILELRESTPPSEVSNAWYQVRKKLSDINQSLPSGVYGPYFNDEFGDTFGSIVALSGDGYSYAELKELADFVRQRLLGVDSVSKVELLGVQDEKVFIEFSQKKFSQLGIPFSSIVEQLSAQNAIESQGALVTPTENLHIQITGAISSMRDLENLQLHAGNRTFRLGDFAEIKREYIDPPKSKMHFNGKEVIGLGVSMEKGGDIIALGEQLAATLTKIEAKLPLGVQLERVTDQPKVVKESVHEFIHVLIEAVVVVLAVSFLALGLHTKPLRIDVRPGLVVALTIPLVLAVTFLFMYILNINLHKISLGALIIALGLLVDDAIIAVEMMVRKLEEGKSRFEAATFAYTSTAIPMLTGTLITAAGFLPIGLAKSAAGEYTFSIFSVNAIALILSWLIAVIFTPYIGVLLLKVKPGAEGGAHHEIFDTPFYERFRHLVSTCVEWRKTTIAVTLGVFLLGLFGFKFIEQQFFPDSSRAEIMVELWLPEGASYHATEEQVNKLEAFLAQEKDIESVASYIGTGSPRFYLPLDQIFPQSNVAQLVILPTSLKARDRLRLTLTELFKNDFPGVRGRVKLLPLGPPVPYAVQFRVSGEDVSTVLKIAGEVKAVMDKNPNLQGLNDNWNESVKVLRVDVDQDKLRTLGIGSKTVMQTINTLLTGTPIGQYRENDKLIDIIVRQPLEERATIDALSAANIPTASGKTVPLGQIAHINLVWEPGVVWRYNREWAVTVQSDVVDGIQGATVSDQISPELDPIREALPPGYQIVAAGVAADTHKAQSSIVANIPLVLFIIFTLLMLQLHSFSRALLVFMTGPLGIAGVAMSLLLLQRPFGFVALLGVIALFGMIIRNSVILIDQIEQHIREGMAPWHAVIESAVHRFRPIILTAAAAVLAMIPLSRSVFWGPMAVAIMGGLIVATGLTLFFLPAAYATIYKVRKPEVGA
jgi:multidrug efflux pump